MSVIDDESDCDLPVFVLWCYKYMRWRACSREFTIAGFLINFSQLISN